MFDRFNEQKLQRYGGVLTGFIAFIIYITTTCRSIWIGDSGEFSLVLKTLGICHPPGYPLFTILGRFFIILTPFWRVTFAANIFNVVITAAGVAAVYYLFKKYFSYQLAFILSLLWAFSPLYWAEAAGVEVYPLNILLIVLTLIAAQSNHQRRWIITAYLFGLALTNHPTAFSILPILIYLFIRDKAYKRIELYPAIIAAIAIAGSLYLYLLVRSSAGPLANWGNPNTIGRLIDHITLTQYSQWIDHSWANVIFTIRLTFISLLKSWQWLGVALCIAGIAVGFRKYFALTLGAIMMIIALILISSSHQALNYEPFFIPAMLAFLILIGIALGWIESKLKNAAIKYGLYIIGFGFCVIMLFTNYSRMDKSSYTLSEDYSKLILDNAEKGILLTGGDINSFATLYLRYVENYRPAVEVYDRSIRLSALSQLVQKYTRREYQDYYPARLALLKTGKPDLYLAKSHYIYDEKWSDLAVPYYSYGILYGFDSRPKRSLDLPTYPDDYDPGDVLSRQLLAHLDLCRGEKLLNEQPYDTASGVAAYAMALVRFENDPRALPLNDIGIYYRSVGQLELALKAYDLALAKPIIVDATRDNITLNISNVYKDYGNRYLSVKDYRNAAANFAKAVDYDPKNDKLLLNVGLIYANALGDTANACIYLQKYLNLMPSDGRVRQLYNTLNK